MLPPLHLYRHRGYTASQIMTDRKTRERLDEELRAALTGRVWFSDTENQNDPFDTHPSFSESKRIEIKHFLEAYQKECGNYVGLSGNDLRTDPRSENVVPSKIRKTLNDPKFFRDSIHKIVSEFRKDQKICCFTDTPLSNLMWSYYSASHSSFCYEFKRSDDADEAAKSMVADVRYLSDRPSLNTVEVARWIANRNRGQEFQSSVLRVSEKERERVGNALVLTKPKEWSHEREWRSIQPPGEERGYYSIKPYQLNAVVFGVSTPVELKAFVADALGDRIKYRKIELDKEQYVLKMGTEEASGECPIFCV